MRDLKERDKQLIAYAVAHLRASGRISEMADVWSDVEE